MKAGKKLLALLLTVCMLLCMLPTVAFASGSDYLKIAMLDSGRKYFSADWVKAFLYEAKADGYTHVMLAVGNDGMRFLLDDMSLTVGGKTYSSDAVASAIRAGNNAYTTASSGEWTESEMDEFFATAKKVGIEIIPLLNSPGHMDSVLYAASSLTGTNCSYNGSSRTIDVTNDTAVRFSQAFLQKYVDYFAGKGCRYFNFGADEYANDRYTSGSMGFGSLQNSGKYGYFIKYVNELAAMVKQAGMTPIAFNDGIEFANKMSASVGSTTYTFDRDIVVCYWSGGWSGYTPRTAANLASDGFRIINTTGDFYYVLGKSDSFDNGYTYAANWSNYKVCGTSLSASSVIGGMFCMWSDYPGAETQTQEAKKIRLPLRAMGLAMDGAYTSSMDTSVVPGGFNADGSINTDPPAQSHDYRQTASTAATCTEAGSVTYTCADCGDSYTETVPALGHDYAAADDAGDTIYTCTRCGEQHSELLPREYVSVKTGKTTEAYTLDGEQSFTHTGDAAIARGELTVVQGTGTKVSYSASASASVSGYTDGGYNCVASNLIDGDTSTYYWSTSCQTSGMYARVDLGAEVRFDAVQISAPAHGDYCTNANVQLSSDGRTWTTIGTFTSSCSTAVTKTYAVPSSVESFRYIQVTLTTARNYWWQLSEIAWGSYDGATFTRAAASGTVQTGTAPMTEVRFTGVAAGTTYYVIGGTRYVIEVEADHIHSYQEVSRTTATCTEDGVTTYRCETCGDTYIETTPATGHSYTAAVTAPTCTEKGYTTYTCTACGDHYTANEVAALGHDYAETTVPATCTENGSVTHTCTRCGNSYTETLPATGHTYTVSGSEATCTEGGKTVHTCTVCGDTYTETTPAHGHDYKAVVTAPTCTEKGYTTYTCKRCGDHYTADEVAALGHDYEAVVTAPTCTEDGYTTYTCATCGDHYTADEVAALGHDYEAVVTAPTCTEDGYTTYTCRNCGDRRTGHVVGALGHTYECTENGNDRIYTCTRCGDTYTEAILPTVEVKLQPGETYTFHTEDAAVTESADPAVAATTIEALSGGYQQVTELAEGTFLLVSGDRMLTATASTYYSSWDGAGTVSGLTCAAYSTAGDLSNALWTVTAVSGGYTVQSADGRYLNLTESTRSASVTLTTAPQVLTITDLGSAFSIRFSDTYLDRYSTTFAGAYPGNANANERWQLYRAVPAGYDVTITGVAEGATRTVIGGVRYAVTVHAHSYTATVTTAATCTTPGVRTYACACGESYTEEIPATGHSYVRTEENGNYVYTCSACGDSYTEPVKTATYDSVSRLTSGGRYVLTVYASGGYYAMTHDGTTIGAQAITIENGRITSDVTESMLWDYSNGCFSFQSGTTTYYLYKSGYSSLRISTSGTSVSYWYNRLGFGNAYLRYSNGSFYLTRWNYSYCYLFQEMNGI
ncbi:family 20 glycosylhydrolase [Faecousia sp.]|uniref:family 20 glycosylhydrolase n=1 Tax=Faecousia sp. TaxID=2952921 RepID=UPI003A8D6CEE